MIETLPGFYNLPPELQAAVSAGFYGIVAVIILSSARFCVGMGIHVCDMRGRAHPRLSAASMALSLTLVGAGLATAHGVVSPILEAMPR